MFLGKHILHELNPLSDAHTDAIRGGFNVEHPIYWIGIRESEIIDTQGLFSGSITIFGSGKNGNRSFERNNHLRFDYNQDYPGWEQFVRNSAEAILTEEPTSLFMLYDTEELDAFGPIIVQRAICINNPSLISLLGNKFQTRQWLHEIVPILPYWMGKGASLNYSALQNFFPGTKEFTLQASASCGGSGTFLVTKENFKTVLRSLDIEAIFAVTPFIRESISPNIHLVIYDDSVLLLPASIQLFDSHVNVFSYKGADFPMFQSLPDSIKQSINKYAMEIGNSLRRAGYRGVCGVDFLVTKNSIYFMEVNARFQSSSFLINRALRDAGIKDSLQSMNINAFCGKRKDQIPHDISVKYSFFHYSYVHQFREQLQFVHALFQKASEVQCIDDALNWEDALIENTYLFKAVWNRNIASFSPDHCCRIHENAGLNAAHYSCKTLKADIERLKILILSHGVRLSEQAEKKLDTKGGFNHEEFDALDLIIKEHIYICAPFRANLSQISPFCIEADRNDSFFISFYGKRLITVGVRQSDEYGNLTTSNGIPLREIVYLSNDRLRIYHRPGCFFKDCGLGCAFCNVEENPVRFSIDDIFQAVDIYRNHPSIRHYLIGGGSESVDSNFEEIINICEYLRNTDPKPIYLMSLPPQSPEILKMLFDAGVTEVAFNLEMFDRTYAERYMPGKGAIPLSTYEAAFRSATKLWGKNGRVRSLFVVGLEPVDSLLRGVEYVAHLGVAPILSLFRPLPETQLSCYVAPTDDEIWEIYQQAKRICSIHGLELGPSCPFCEDNVLKITL